MRDNAIEWITGDAQVTVTFDQRKYISKIKRLAEKYPDEVQITDENDDGSIVAHIPLRYIKVSRPAERTLTEEQRQAAAERFAKARESRQSQIDLDEEDDDDEE